MKISRLELENWMGIPRLELDFSQGINLVYGRNEIGKSSVIESIRQAILGDASSKKTEYKVLRPWGGKEKAVVKLFFTAKDKRFHLTKSFPGGDSELYQEDVLLTRDPKKLREKLFPILDISEKTTNLFRLLFINQGESLEIFDEKTKENPLDDNTKSYIKEVIKETAFREIQELQDFVGKELNNYLTPSRERVSSKSEYKDLLNKETQLAEELDGLKKEEEQLREKLAQIETNDREIERFEEEILAQEQYLEALKTKRDRLDLLEKKELAFTPIQTEYHRFTQIASDLDKIRQRLPQLLAARENRIRQLHAQKEELETEKTLTLKTLDKMKRKKQAGENIQHQSRQFESIKTAYDEITGLENKAVGIRENLPQLLTTAFNLQKDRMNKISEKLHLRSKLEKELSTVQSSLKEFPQITRDHINTLRKMASEITRLNDRIASSRDQLKLNFHLTPLEQREIPYTLETDRQEPQHLSTAEPLDISGFQKLRFNYHGHLDIHVSGDLGETRFDDLLNEFLSISGQLKEKLAAFDVESVDQLQEKFDQLSGLKTTRDSLEAQLQSFEKLEQLERQENETARAIQSLERDSQAYADEIPPEEQTGWRNQSLQDVNKQLTTAKTSLEGFQQRKEQLLATQECTFPELEQGYQRLEKELKTQNDHYRNLEPEDIETVEETHLESTASTINEIEKKVDQCAHDISLLEEMEVPGFEPGDPIQPPAQSELKTQQLRDDISQTFDHNKRLESEQSEVLGEMTRQEFEINYKRGKDELEQMRKDVKEFPPHEFQESQAVEKEIENTEIDIESIRGKKAEIDKNRQSLIGQTAGYARVFEEITLNEFEYERVLQSIKGEISQIASLKLIDRLIEEEMDKAQQEIFKPLQDRVVDSFSALVGERYKIAIDNDLNLEVSGRTRTGEYQPDVDKLLSYGTKEQLSFLLRLAIAMQLSRKEPGVMVLDDSFVNTDLDRFPLILNMLCEKTPDLQFLVFTCRPSDYLSYFPTWNDKHLRYIDLEKLLNK